MAAAILSVFILAGCPNDGGTETDPSITGLVITGGTEAVKGSYVDLSASLTWSNNTKTSTTQVAWSITGQLSNDTNINSSGRLSVDSSETAATITVKADYTEDDDVSGTLQIKVITPTEGKVPTVKKVTITASKGEVTITEPVAIKNDNTDSIMLTANVEVANNPNYSVTWSVLEGDSTGVTFSPNPGESTTLIVEESGVPGPIKVRATVTETVFDDIEITIEDANLEPGKKDFKTKTNANLLGLYPGVDGYNSVTELIDAMDDRSYPGRTDFYNPSIPIDLSSYGITDAKRGDVKEIAPTMAWYINSSDQLIVHGSATSGASIKFDVAVINATTGTGWVTITPYEEAYDIYDGRNTEIDLTGTNSMTKLPNLTGYKVYIIVRALNGLDSIPDFNLHEVAKTHNVIEITPTSP